MKTITKSCYETFKKCPLHLWLHLYKKDEEKLSDEKEMIAFNDTKKVKELAKSYFDNTVDCTFTDENGKTNYDKQIELTKEALINNANCIAKASFRYDDLVCSVDLLKKDDDGYSIYKAESKLDIKVKENHGIAFQKYVLEKAGIKVNHCYIMHPNRDYVFFDSLDKHSYFKIDCMDGSKEFGEIDTDIESIRNLLNENKEPSQLLNTECNKCPFCDYCMGEINDNSVRNISGLHHYKLINEGIKTVSDYNEYAKAEHKKINDLQKVQIQSCLNNEDLIVDKDKLNGFLGKIRYPIYHLDFETTRLVIPKANGMHPSEECPTQYSLHVEQADGRIDHYQFLADNYDCTRELAERLVHDIPKDSCLLAFHSSTEAGIIEKLAEKYPDLKDHLLNLAGNFIDLLEPFRNGYYYKKKAARSNSIKEIMPALCPHMADAYRELAVVHNGHEALDMFDNMIMKKGTPEYDEIREGMFKYCELDTLSMVEVLKVLRKA